VAASTAGATRKAEETCNRCNSFRSWERIPPVLEIENISEDQKLQIQLALKDGGCGVRSHDLKELQHLYVSSALLGGGPGLD